MKVRLAIAIPIVAACLVGIFAGEFIYRCVQCRSSLGELFGRGRLLARVNGTGIYEADVLRATGEQRYLGPDEQDEISDKTTESRLTLSGLVASAMAEHLARDGKVSSEMIDHEYDILRAQLGTSKAWTQALRTNGISSTALRRSGAKRVRTERWIERGLANETTTSAEDCLRYYETHAESYSQPLRFRASHIFLAAPPETAPAIVEKKRRLIEQLFTRLAHGEDFRDLSARMSEDEATRARGGDLGFFSQARMPSDFFAAVATLRVGELSGVIRTRLGFHIVQLTGSEAPHQMTLSESWPEIALFLGNERRQVWVKALLANLSRRAEFVRPSL